MKGNSKQEWTKNDIQRWKTQTPKHEDLSVFTVVNLKALVKELAIPARICDKKSKKTIIECLITYFNSVDKKSTVKKVSKKNYKMFVDLKSSGDYEKALESFAEELIADVINGENNCDKIIQEAENYLKKEELNIGSKYNKPKTDDKPIKQYIKSVADDFFMVNNALLKRGVDDVSIEFENFVKRVDDINPTINTYRK